MKRKNYITKTLFLFATLFLASCSEDLYENQTNNHDNASKFKTTRGSFKQFNLLETTKKLKIYDNSITNNKSNSGFHFIIDTTNILKMYSENTESYTLKVSNENTPDGSFQNLIIKKTAFSPTKAYLMTYYPTEKYKRDYLTNPQASFEGSATIINLKPEHLHLAPLGCLDGTIQLCNTGGNGTHIAYCNDCTPYTLSGTICDDSILDSPGGDDGPGLIGGGASSGSGANNNDGGGSIFNVPTFVEPPYMDLTEFMSTEDNYKFNTIMQNVTLNAKGYQWFGTDVNKIRSVYAYLFANNFSTQSTDIIDDMITYCNNNGNTPDVLAEVNNIFSLLTGGTINGQAVDFGDSTPITNMSQYLSCFNTTQGAVLTISADQPDAGDHDLFTISGGVGHSFITIQQGSKIRSLGFYPISGPQSGIPNLNTPDPNDFINTPGEFHNNQSTSFDVSLSVPISATQLTHLINSTINVANSNPVYNLSTLNCTDVAIFMFEANTNVNLPNCESPNILWDGQTPGTLGEIIRNFTTPSGGTKNTNGGTSPQNNG